MSTRIASLSLDLDNQWSYMKTHGDAGWETYPTYLDRVVPRALSFLKDHDQKITFFIVGQDGTGPIHPVYVVGLAPDGSLTGLRTRVQWS